MDLERLVTAPRQWQRLPGRPSWLFPGSHQTGHWSSGGIDDIIWVHVAQICTARFWQVKGIDLLQSCLSWHRSFTDRGAPFTGQEVGKHVLHLMANETWLGHYATIAGCEGSLRPLGAYGSRTATGRE